MAEHSGSSLVRQVLALRSNNKTTEIWLEMTLIALRRHRDDFDSVVERMPPGVEIEQSFTTIIKEMFSDGIVNYGRLAIAMAFAVYLQQRFGVDLKSETATIVEERLFNCMLNGGGGSERRHFPTNMELFDWITYGTVMLLSKIRHYI